ncbi:MAG: leucyl/phenylalanyl-tRNA--protein transferase [Gammaproteobacteria bacterium]|nr:leucyl/phenylalanyl-tRNA--protein transferase [Gammaproteobacteria bacterium]
MSTNSAPQPLYWVAAQRFAEDFPAAATALREPDGLLAVGGDLHPVRLLAAYRRGIFPWFSAGQPILWWSPDPRAVLWPRAVHVSRSLVRSARRAPVEITIDRAFEEVVEACALPRRGETGTWITPDMKRGYLALHELGHAHSIECRDGDALVGGLYGVAVGRMFFGESMFSRRTDGSKHALVAAARMLEAGDYVLLDCQIMNPHLASMGATFMPRREFLGHVATACEQAPAAAAWRLLPEVLS